MAWPPHGQAGQPGRHGRRRPGPVCVCVWWSRIFVKRRRTCDGAGRWLASQTTCSISVHSGHVSAWVASSGASVAVSCTACVHAALPADAGWDGAAAKNRVMNDLGQAFVGTCVAWCGVVHMCRAYPCLAHRFYISPCCLQQPPLLRHAFIIAFTCASRVCGL